MKKLILLILLCNTFFSFGQKRYAANRHYEEFAYLKAAELYEEIYKKGDSSKLVLTRLGNSYYFNTDVKNAEKWYEKLFKIHHPDSISPEYYFRFSQVLKSNGKYKESDDWLLKFKNLKQEDSRGKELIDKSNYFSEYTNKEHTVVNIHNLSTNTSYSDFGSFIYDNKMIFASTRPDSTLKRNKLYKWNKQPFLNLYQGKELTLNKENSKDKVLDLKELKKLPVINTKYHEATAIITRDGKTMYFTRDNYDGRKLRSDKKRTAHLKLYKAMRINNQWDSIQELPFNSDDFSIGHPTLSVDEKELYFVSDMPGGYGYTDIYKVKILDHGEFSEPQNLGKIINTEGREMFPFISSNNILYFSSDGHIGLGALDVFESQIQVEKYLEVVNLGAPVNSPLDDFSFVLDSLKTKGYFSSNRKGGKGDDDIYSFNVYRCKETIEGIVTDKISKEIIANAQVLLIDSEGKIIETSITDSQGIYRFKTQLDCEQEGLIVAANKIDYKSDKKDTATLDIDQLVIKVDLVLTPLIINNEIVINPIFFDFDKYYIREDAKYELEYILTVMNNHPEMIIKIESHTDSRGSMKYNERLSTNRAKSTRDYLISRGIASNRIQSATGYGEYQLLNECTDENDVSVYCSEEKHQRNRRTKFIIVSSGDLNIKAVDPKNVKLKRVDPKKKFEKYQKKN